MVSIDKSTFIKLGAVFLAVGLGACTESRSRTAINSVAAIAGNDPGLKAVVVSAERQESPTIDHAAGQVIGVMTRSQQTECTKRTEIRDGKRVAVFGNCILVSSGAAPNPALRR